MSRMTLKEKIDLLGGTGFGTKEFKNLGIPSMKMDDGPLGVRWGKATAFPSGPSIASTWDTTLVRKVGEAIGREVRGKGRNVILGPNVNIARMPLNGRTFEAYGEDPYLTSRMAVSYIKGVQKEHVAATIKHFVANNEEDNRMYVDDKVSKRALEEIYFPAFKAAVKDADVLAVMAAYNKVNGYYCSENNYLLNEVLKNEWGFKGLIMSDWGAVHSSIPTMNNGLDLEMPTGKYLNNKTLDNAIKDGTIKVATINDKVRRILRVMFKLGMFDHQNKADSSLVNSSENRQIALQTEKEGIILLKNQNDILPLNTKKLKTIAVIGTSASIARVTGGGSAMVTPYFSVSPLQALREKLGGKVRIHYAPGVMLNSDVKPVNPKFVTSGMHIHGWEGKYYNSDDFSGDVQVKRTDKVINFRDFGSDNNLNLDKKNFKKGFSVIWSGNLSVPKSGNYVFDIVNNNIFELYIDGKLVAQAKRGFGADVTTYKTHLVANRKYRVRLKYQESPGMPVHFIKFGLRPTNEEMIREAEKIAANSDMALVFVGDSKEVESEGHDRTSLSLAGRQDELIEAIAGKNKHTVVVINAGAPVTMPWLEHVDGVVDAWFGGEEVGNAITDVLTGNYNPSGKLCITFPRKWSDEPAYKTYMPKDSVAHYSEGIFVGYRYFDKNDITPLFPFGYGLSYTTFSYDDLKINSESSSHDPDIKGSFRITNTGKRTGAEVAEIYVGEQNPEIVRPVKELKNFARIELKPGESKMVHFTLNRDAFHYYNPMKNQWTVDPGKYDIMIGRSSRDIPLKKVVVLK